LKNEPHYAVLIAVRAGRVINAVVRSGFAWLLKGSSLKALANVPAGANTCQHVTSVVRREASSRHAFRNELDRTRRISVEAFFE
jgi:hypothetical protein